MESLLIQFLLAILLHESCSLESKRLLLHDPESIANALHQLGTKIEELNTTIAQMMVSHSQDVAHLNATHSRDVAQLKAEHAKEVADLKAGLNAEKLERCRTGSIGFHHEECAQQHCSESQVIDFSPPFTKVPVVSFAFSAMDVNKDRNFRIGSIVKAVTTSSATLTVNTWADSVVYGSSLNWIACPNM
ncbi:uncharacterized protein LOC132728181 isoform X1 [Ruditapes philippinarum]|uniref:uncharacterized protein LOC132728181 isoform X1 n=1 Tax=Ruditapes philippinarum TaxID=129788 RepID=UPI00295C025D|nr:uncharacterized protein LOC132728181 isoform X1 [Ruditapes philippinarum]